MNGLTTVELEARLAPLVCRHWPIARLRLVYQDRIAGRSNQAIADSLDIDFTTVCSVARRMIKAGLLEKRHDNWSPEKIAIFRTLWDEGHGPTEIARRMGLNKNAAVGHSHRAVADGTLAARPHYAGNLSPETLEKRRAAAQARDVVHQKRMELQRTKREARAAERPPKAAKPSNRLPPTALSRPLKPAPRPKPEPYVPPPPKYGRVAECCWPLGTPGTPGFHFCDQSTEPGRPYCHRHVQKAYVKTPVSERREARA